MLSALIPTRLGYPAMHLAAQPACQRSVRHGPLVLVSNPRKPPTPTIDRDRTVSRRSEPSSGGISLLSPEYLLSFERRPFHTESPDHYAPVSCLIGPSASQSSALLPLHSIAGYQSAWGHLWKPPLLFWRRPPQSNYPPSGVPLQGVRNQTAEGPYFNGGSKRAGARFSLPPAYPTHRRPGSNAKL